MGYYDDYFKHHGILGQKHGVLNGPPYPLRKGDHSSSEKKAAAKAGIKVGKDSGKGSIENVKKTKPRKPLTEEEKRLKAEEAYLKGDSKNITKYMDKLTTPELQDASYRAQIRKNLEGPKEKSLTKAEKEKRDAMLSGDKEKIKEQADKMSYQELQEAMNKMDLMQKLNYQPPKPTTMDKIDSAMKKVDKARDWMDKGLKAYDALAAINNTFNKDSQWPRAKFNNNDSKKDDKNEKKNEDKLEKIIKNIANDAKNAHQENVQEEKAKVEKAERKEADKAAKKEEKAEKKAEKAAEKAAKKESKEDTIERVKGTVVDNDRDPFDTSNFTDASWRDVDVNKSAPEGERILNQYLLEDKKKLE